MLWLLNIIAYIINAVFVGGGGSLGFFGEDIGTVSDRNPIFISPASYAFSIWGLIFAAELVFVLWGAFGSNRDSPVLTKGVSVFFIIACISQAAWIVAFTMESLVLSAVLLLVIAGSLATIVIRLAYFKLEEHGLFFTIPFWTVHFPIGLHGGWTLAASLVNITVALETDNLSTQTAALILATVAAAVAASLASLVFYDPVYLAAIVWAIAAIAANEDYRIERLGKPVADGVTEGLEAVWIMLVCVAVVGTIAFGVARAESDKHAAEQNLPQRHRATSGTARHAATLAVVSS